MFAKLPLMTRRVNWSLIFLLAGFIIIAATPAVWLTFLEPIIPQDQGEVVFTCPDFVQPNLCDDLAELDEENPDEAAAMLEALSLPPFDAPIAEADEESIREGIDLTTVSAFSETRVRIGNFTEIDALHQGSGQAVVWELVADDNVTQILRLENNFEVTRGPNLRIYFSIHPDPRTPEEVFQGDLALEVGGIKGNRGAQNFVLPEDFDPTQYNSIAIISDEFETVFTTAPLQRPLDQ